MANSSDERNGHGIRRFKTAKIDGEFMDNAPYGHIMLTLPDGTKLLCGAQATPVLWHIQIIMATTSLSFSYQPLPCPQIHSNFLLSDCKGARRSRAVSLPGITVGTSRGKKYSNTENQPPLCNGWIETSVHIMSAYHHHSMNVMEVVGIEAVQINVVLSIRWTLTRLQFRAPVSVLP